MKVIFYVLAFTVFLFIAGCVEKFVPNLHSTQYYLVANGLITNQPEVYTVNLFWSITPGETTSVPITGCDVTVYDDLGHVYQFAESATPGYYISDTSTFRGVIGRIYTLHIETNNATPLHHSYESEHVEMKEVPPIDSLYFEKVLISEKTPTSGAQEGCQIYLDAYDPQGTCRFYRWDYTETWNFKIPWEGIANSLCWISENSKNINIKSTAVLSQDMIKRYPLTFISNETDRLSEKYSILVNQYSISEKDYSFWEQARGLKQNNGGLYDIIPYSLAGNLVCIEDPGEKVLGNFSVSAKSSKRIFIHETFEGLENIYRGCPADTFHFVDPNLIPGLNVTRWIIYECHGTCGNIEITTNEHSCADCTVRGTKTKPDFWVDLKKN